LAAAIFDDDGVNPLKIQKMRKHKAGRPCPYNPDLSSR